MSKSEEPKVVTPETEIVEEEANPNDTAKLAKLENKVPVIALCEKK